MAGSVFRALGILPESVEQPAPSQRSKPLAKEKRRKRIFDNVQLGKRLGEKDEQPDE
jgi:hypothetical protein